MSRDLDWEGCLNARDLGGLPTGDGHETLWGAVVRSDNPAYLTAAGWSALHAYGIRTIVALRTIGAADAEPEPSLVPSEVTIERVWVEDGTDAEFHNRCVATDLFCTPVYFRDMLELWPDRCAAAVAAVVHARPGGVLIACGRGCDRTGLVAFLLLGLIGVSAEDISTDWARSIDRLRPREPNLRRRFEPVLTREGTTVRASIEDTLATIDIAQRLRVGGLTDGDLAAVRGRLVGQASSG